MLLAQLEYQLDNSILTQRTLRLRIGAADVALAYDRCAARLRRKFPVAGFRKGRAPLAVVRRELKDRISAEAFRELKQAAIEQVMRQLDEADKPLLPPEVLDPDKLRLRYNQQLEFAVKYLIDPAGVARNPAQPAFEQGQVLPGSAVAAAQPPGAVRPVQAPGIPAP